MGTIKTCHGTSPSPMERPCRRHASFPGWARKRTTRRRRRLSVTVPRQIARRRRASTSRAAVHPWEQTATLLVAADAIEKPDLEAVHVIDFGTQHLRPFSVELLRICVFVVPHHYQNLGVMTRLVSSCCGFACLSWPIITRILV